MLENFVLLMVLGVIEPCFVWFLMLMNLIITIYGSQCYRTMVCLGSDGLEPFIIGGFWRYYHA